MKITKIETKIVNISSYSNWIFVLVTTDKGILGLGESTLDGHEADVVKTIEAFSHQLVGQDPLMDIIPWQEKTSLVHNAALSGLDIALWDIRGKYQDKPVYALLSDHPTLEIPMYVTFNRVLKQREPDAFYEIASHFVKKAGYCAIKCAPFDGYTSDGNNDPALLEAGIQRVAAMRDAIGPDIKLMVDCHWRFDLKDAVRTADQIREHNIFWFEAPVSENDPTLLSSVREKTKLRIAGFEMQTALSEAQSFLETGALDVYMPDIKYIGGITKMIEISRMIKAFGQSISPHNMTGPVATLASMHTSAAFNHLVHLEYHVDEAPYIPALSDFRINLSDGKHTLSDAPGLGVQLNLTEIDKHPYQPTVSFRQNMLGG